VTESKSDRRKSIEKTMMSILNQDVSKLPDIPDRALFKKNFKTMQPTISLGIPRTHAPSRSCYWITKKIFVFKSGFKKQKELKYDSPSISPQSLTRCVGVFVTLFSSMFVRKRFFIIFNQNSSIEKVLIFVAFSLEKDFVFRSFLVPMI
jgi:hypothetical protein